jgi:hypothetical protein
MNLKKYTPFIIPTISLLLVLFLAFRWYNLRTQRDNDLRFGEIEIEDLTEEETEVVIGAPDTSTVELEAEDEQLAAGQVRYRIDDERVLFNVLAELPLDDSAIYQAWISTRDQEIFQRAFVLQLSKGGYMGSASISKEQLPLEIIVSRETESQPEEIGEELLRGEIQEEVEEE